MQQKLQRKKNNENAVTSSLSKMILTNKGLIANTTNL